MSYIQLLNLFNEDFYVHGVIWNYMYNWKQVQDWKQRFLVLISEYLIFLQTLNIFQLDYFGPAPGETMIQNIEKLQRLEAVFAIFRIIVNQFVSDTVHFG